jgi:hypothetical protein
MASGLTVLYGGHLHEAATDWRTNGSENRVSPPETVQTPNSLRGAVLVQGMMFAFRARERYGAAVPITEAHPKALLRMMGLHKSSWDSIATKFSLIGKEPPSEHERDAILASVAARNGVKGAWTHDLSLVRDERELDPKRMWFGEVSYFWPN